MMRYNIYALGTYDPLDLSRFPKSSKNRRPDLVDDLDEDLDPETVGYDFDQEDSEISGSDFDQEDSEISGSDFDQEDSDTVAAKEYTSLEETFKPFDNFYMGEGYTLCKKTAESILYHMGKGITKITYETVRPETRFRPIHQPCHPSFAGIAASGKNTSIVSVKTGYTRGTETVSRGFHKWTIVWPFGRRSQHSVVGVSNFNPDENLCVGWHLKTGCVINNTTASVVSYHSAPEKISVLLDMENGTLGFSVEDVFMGVAARDLSGYKLSLVFCTTGKENILVTYDGCFYPLPESLAVQSARRIDRDTISELMKTYTMPKELYYI